jgi:hypothetical protein
VIAKKFSPTVGGLFLAFPSTFPTSATLVDKHEKEKKTQAGQDGRVRGCLAANLDARGAAMGSLGLIAFALIIWRFLGQRSAGIVLGVGTAIWFTVSILLWCGRRMARV